MLEKMPHSLARRRQIGIIIGIIAVLVIAGGAVVADSQLSRFACSNLLSRSVLTDASKYLDQSKQQQLLPIVTKIRAIRNYDHDPNCLYVAVSYDVYSSNTQVARADFTKLKRTYNAKPGFDSALGKTQDISTLEKLIGLLESGSSGDVIQDQPVPNI